VQHIKHHNKSVRDHGLALHLLDVPPTLSEEHRMTTVRLGAAYIGQVGGTNIYRVDLAQSGFANVASITVHDDNALSGGTGSHSGLDLDFVRFLTFAANDASEVTGRTSEPVFDFSPSGVVFEPGFQTPLNPWDPADWSASLQGTTGANVYDPALASLNTLDSKVLSLGEGGQVTFLLKSAPSTQGRYFYFGDAGGRDLANYVLVSDAPQPDLPRDFTITGTSGNDTIRIGAGLNQHLHNVDVTVYGLGGNDEIYGAFGSDKLYGHGGKDVLSGGSGSDWLFGGSGNDRILGGSGNDWIYGEAGNDRLKGEDGRDTFVFSTKASARSNMDRILDFNPKQDSIYLENAVFTKIGKGSLANPKKLSKGAFWSGDAAHDTSDRIIYDKDSGALYYDRDGTGSASQVKFAQVSKGLKVSVNDFFII
jgi:Ca2+-binding RTX toxin-like protein